MDWYFNINSPAPAGQSKHLQIYKTFNFNLEKKKNEMKYIYYILVTSV